jgi:hypothetical protein
MSANASPTDPNPRDLPPAGRPSPEPGFDAAFASALHDVAIPSGLEGRILARIHAESPSPANVVTKKRWRPTRRHAVLAAITTGLLACLAVFFVPSLVPRPAVPREQLTADVLDWLSSKPAAWQPISAFPRHMGLDSAVPAAASTPPRGLLHVRSRSWSGTAVSVELAPAGAPRATLFVVRSQTQFAVPSAPATTFRLGLTGGYTATAWQRPNGLLYVLVVETDRGQRLEDFLRRPAQA